MTNSGYLLLSGSAEVVLFLLYSLSRRVTSVHSEMPYSDTNNVIKYIRYSVENKNDDTYRLLKNIDAQKNPHEVFDNYGSRLITQMLILGISALHPLSHLTITWLKFVALFVEIIIAVAFHALLESGKCDNTKKHINYYYTSRNIPAPDSQLTENEKQYIQDNTNDILLTMCTALGERKGIIKVYSVVGGITQLLAIILVFVEWNIK